MLPGMIEVIVGITPASFVADPFAVGVNVRSIWMSTLVNVVFRRRVWRSYRCGTVSGRMSTAAFMVLRER